MERSVHQDTYGTWLFVSGNKRFSYTVPKWFHGNNNNLKYIYKVSQISEWGYPSSKVPRGKIMLL